MLYGCMPVGNIIGGSRRIFIVVFNVVVLFTFFFGYIILFRFKFVDFIVGFGIDVLNMLFSMCDM